MTADPEERFAVLHALRVKGVAEPDDVERISGVAGAAAALAALAAAGLVAEHGAHYALTDAGREAERHETDERSRGGRDALAAIYDERFGAVNVRFKQLCTDWQEQGGRAALLEEAADVHDEIAAVLRDAAPHAPHLGRYAERLETAMDAFLDGDASALDGHGGSSYHTTWFELHEDLIATLGRTRSQEAA